MRPVLAALALLCAGPARPAGTPHVTLVACAPGQPGTAAEAQPGMDALAAAVAREAGWPAASFGAVYEPQEREGLARLAAPDAAVALVPVPFLVRHGAALRLSPLLVVASAAAPAGTERWTLVARRGRVAEAGALADFTISSTAGYAPGFVRAALSGWGRLPASTRIVASSQVLSALRRAAAGDPVAVLLDGAQSAALPSLPFAGDLEVVARSAPLPAGLVTAVGDRLPSPRRRALEAALRALPAGPAGADALEALRIARFLPLDPQAREALRALAVEAR